MVYKRRAEIDKRSSHNRYSVWYAKNSEIKKEKQRISYEKKQASLGKITKQSLNEKKCRIEKESTNNN